MEKRQFSADHCQAAFILFFKAIKNETKINDNKKCAENVLHQKRKVRIAYIYITRSLNIFPKLKFKNMTAKFYKKLKQCIDKA